MTDEEILAAAAQLWGQHAGADFTMDRLCEVTNISRATLYRRFGSRETILQRLAATHAIASEELTRPDVATRIVRATGEALNQLGFAGVTVEKIAQLAGVGPATVYRHFGNKDALIEAFITANTPRQLLHNLTVHTTSDLKSDLVLVATAFLEFVRDNPGLVRLFAFDDQSENAYLANVRATQGRTLTMLADYLAGHITLGNLPPHEPMTLALSFIGMLLGVGLIGPQTYNHPISTPDAIARQITDLFLHGVTYPTHPPHPQTSLHTQKVEAQR